MGSTEFRETIRQQLEDGSGSDQLADERALLDGLAQQLQGLGVGYERMANCQRRILTEMERTSGDIAGECALKARCEK